jgi:hypothetical protein
MNKKNWKSFWENYRSDDLNIESDLFLQVGKTIDKKPISKIIFNEMVQDISDKLQLNKSDTLLEMCCGNGLLTAPLSQSVEFIYAFDFTERLIEIANKLNHTKNVVYAVGDAKADLFTIFNNTISVPNKFLMNDSLGYFNIQDLESIIVQLIKRPFEFYITGVPSESLKLEFYNNNERIERYQILKAKGDDFNDGIGRWWSCDDFFEIARKFKLNVQLFRQPFSVSPYRMNVLYSNLG